MPLTPVSDSEFARWLGGLGPFEPAPHLAAAVSGGADSMAVSWLASRWAQARGGRLTALIVDHGLRAASAEEAALAASRLGALGIACEVILLADLRPGPALAERARRARYAALLAACARRGVVHLLLGHHAGDQAETVAMRAAAGSGPHGLAGMAALVETEAARLLRPVLHLPTGRLRATLRAAGLGWSEDPSNRDTAALRVRVRMARGDPDGSGPATCAAVRQAAECGGARARDERAIADCLAARAMIHPLGFAVLQGGPIRPDALAALLRMVSGAAYPPSSRQVARVAATLMPSTLAGVRLLPAGRLGRPGDVLVVREAAAAGPAVPAVNGALWDGRFRLTTDDAAIVGATIGALGREADIVPRAMRRGVPAAVLHGLPALRRAGRLVAVPALAFPSAAACAGWRFGWVPAVPASAGTFLALPTLA